MTSFLNLVLLSVCIAEDLIHAQCYQDSDLSLYQFGYPSEMYQEQGSPQCIPDYPVLSENVFGDDLTKGLTCSRKGSTALGTWADTNGTEVVCDDFRNKRRWIHCTRPQPGSITLFPDKQLGWKTTKHNFTCCINESCATIRILHEEDFKATYPDSDDHLAKLESCIIVPPSDLTAIPQQYLVQMSTSVIPFSRISSFINCTDGDGITCGQSYYTLIDIDEERYQMTVPVTWSTDSTTNTSHYYSCRVRFGGFEEDGNGHFSDSHKKSISIKASSAPSSVSYKVVNATAIDISWSISGDVNGFIINITSDGLDTVTIQLTDGLLREYVINGLLLNRNYTVEVRGYYELLGPATTVRLEAKISAINSTLLSVSDDLSTQVIQVNCTTIRVTPDQVTWIVDLVSPDSSYEPVTGSVLLNSTYQTYRHYITLTGLFTDGTTIICNANVNGEIINKDYTLRAPSSPPTGLSAAILSSTSLSTSWTPLSDVNGYIIQYTAGGQSVMVNGKDSSNRVLEGLTQGITYQINIYSYNDLLSTTSTNISILLDVPVLTSFDVQSLNTTSIQLTWSLSDSSIIDSYTLSVTRVCDNIQIPVNTNIGASIESYIFSELSNGFQYFFVLTPVNKLGKGIGRNSTATVEESFPPSVAPLLHSPLIINSTAVRLTWDEVNCSYSNGTITGYRVMYCNELQQCITINITDDTTSTVTGLMEFQLYYFSVTAVNSIGPGPYSEQKSVYTINLTIIDVTVAMSTMFAKLSWQPLPSVANVSYEYEVVYAVIDSAECTGNSVSLPNEYTVYSPRTSNSTIEVLGLMSGTFYVFGVRAYVITLESTSTGESIYIITRTTVVDTIKNFNVQLLASIASLSWSTLPVISIDEYFYEVGYITSDDDECTAAGLSTLPQDYTSYINTTNGSIEVTGLRDDTCYVFGVRMYSARTGQHGEWTLILQHTEGGASDPVTTNSAVSCDNSSTGLVVGLIIMAIIILILLVLLVIQTLWMIIWKRSTNDKTNNILTSKESKTTLDDVYDVPHCVDSIEMHDCKPYQLHKPQPSEGAEVAKDAAIYEPMPI